MIQVNLFTKQESQRGENKLWLPKEKWREVNEDFGIKIYTLLWIKQINSRSHIAPHRGEGSTGTPLQQSGFENAPWIGELKMQSMESSKEDLTFSFHFHAFRSRNKSTQCLLENHREGGAWWALPVGRDRVRHE